MVSRRLLVIALWLLLSAAAIVVVVHARYRADLSAFLPRSPSPLQQLLVQQISTGPASRLILIGIDGGDAHARASASQELAQSLRGQSEFTLVTDGEASNTGLERAFAYNYRYQLSSTVDSNRFSAAGLHDAIADTLALLSSPAGLLAAPLFRSDPTGETLQVIDQLSSGAQPRRCEGVWCSRDGMRALLIAQTRAGGADTDAQERAIGAIRVAFARASAAPLTLRLSGPAVFSVDARATIKREAVRLSLLSTGLIAALLLVAYRSVPALLLGLVPVACGALAAVAAVSLAFGVVYGITLGFGITLIGESVDYPIYLFVQSRGVRFEQVLWPTIALGALTSICGFASLLPSAFPGLAQLGWYSIIGLTVAAIVTRWVLPALLPARLAIADLAAVGAAARALLAGRRPPRVVFVVLALACAAVLWHDRARLWSRDLAALSPVPAAGIRLDAQMRSDLGAPEVGNLVIVDGHDEQAVLQWTEAVAERLDALISERVIGGYDSPTRYLPSRATQLMRLSSVPPSPVLRARLAAATAGLPIAGDTLEPFVQQVTAAQRSGPLTRATLQGTTLGMALDALLWQQGSAWRALLPLHAIADAPIDANIDVARVERALASVAPGHVMVMNMRQQSDALYNGYLFAALRLSLLGLAAIVLLLALTLRNLQRVTRVIAPLLLSVLVVSATFALSGAPMTILHLIGMLLIIAVGSNYALFFDRSAVHADPNALPHTLASLLVANASTVAGFGVLAFSSVPVLSALGRTVAPGTLLALWFAALLAPRSVFIPSGTRN